MKTKLLLLLALLFVFGGCSKDEPAPERTYLLRYKKSQTTLPDGGYLNIDLTYIYNEKDQIVSIDGATVRKGTDEIGTTTIDYDSQGRLTYAANSSGTTWTITYNAKGQIDKIVKRYLWSDTSIQEFFYDNSGQLIQLNAYRQRGRIISLVSTHQYTYAANNTVKIKKINSSGTENKEYSITTDTFKGSLPFLQHQISMEFYTYEVVPEPLLTPHNILSNEVKDVILNQRTGESYTSTFIYNEGGYPITAVRTFEDGSIENIQYIYTSR